MSTNGQIGPDTLVVRSDEPVAVEVDRTVVMMSLAQGMYYGLEGVGPRIWALLEQPRSPAQLCAQLVTEFEVEAGECLGEICEFLEQLRHAELIRIQGATAGAVPSADRG